MSSKYLITFRPKLTLLHFKTHYRWIVCSLQHRLQPCANTAVANDFSHHSKCGVHCEVRTDRTINSMYNYFTFIPPRSL